MCTNIEQKAGRITKSKHNQISETEKQIRVPSKKEATLNNFQQKKKTLNYNINYLQLRKNGSGSPLKLISETSLNAFRGNDKHQVFVDLQKNDSKIKVNYLLKRLG